jgi:hypothetical protein
MQKLLVGTETKIDVAHIDLATGELIQREKPSSIEVVRLEAEKFLNELKDEKGEKP